jgi:putative intracellular protease/amidase
MAKEIFTLLIVLTSHDQLGDTGEKTGFWLEEFTTPYYIYLDAGAKITLASPDGGMPPIDPRSLSKEAQTDSTRRYLSDDETNISLANTIKLSEVNADDYDAIFYPGGHGPLWDLVDNPHSIQLIEAFWAQGKPVSAVCHAPIVLLNAKDSNGKLIVNGREVSGFTNSEEEAVGLLEVVPMLLEDELKARGAKYSKADDFQEYIRIDGNLVTGQNPASAKGVAEAVIDLIKHK